MAIPVATIHQATVAGARVVFVQCENCNTRYVYELARTETGQAITPPFFFNTSGGKAAKAKAEKTLATTLNSDNEAVPCPACGCLQPI